MFYLHHTPWWLRAIFPPGLVWQGPTGAEPKVYLTFDDGPHPEATPFVLEQLAAYGMQGSFFCIGKNVVRYPALYQRILAEGHAIGNHTMEHANGKHTQADDYLWQIQQAQGTMQASLFRPPYGQLTRAQARGIHQQWPDMQVVMWSVLSGDFDTSRTGEYCYKQVKRHTRPGSIIVFHDSAKAMPRLQVALPLTLQYLRQQGWQSAVLPVS